MTPGVHVPAENGVTHAVTAIAIAGPETAKRLGIPIGTPFEARKVVTGIDYKPGEDIIDPSDAALRLEEGRI